MGTDLRLPFSEGATTNSFGAEDASPLGDLAHHPTDDRSGTIDDQLLTANTGARISKLFGSGARGLCMFFPCPNLHVWVQWCHGDR